MSDTLKQQDDSLSTTGETEQEYQPVDGNTGQEVAGNESFKTGDDEKLDKDDESSTSNGKDREEGKDIPNIDLDQINTAGNAEKQENNASLNFYEKINRLSIDIRQESKRVESVLRFHEFRKHEYLPGLKNPSEKDFVRYHAEKMIPLLLEKRVAVVNNDLDEEEMAMAVVESIVFNPAFEGSVSAQSFQRNDPAITLEGIINGFLEYRNKKAEKCSHHFLVIYERYGEAASAGSFLAALLKKGGVADSIAQVLLDENLFILYITSDTGLYKNVIRKQACFVLLHVSPIHQLLFDTVNQHDECQEISGLVETALSEYDWLASLSMEEKKKIITELVRKGEIVNFLSELIRGINQDEAVVVNNLLKDPVHKMVMFVAAFFEGVTISEFDSIVRLLADHGHAKDQVSYGDRYSPVFIWETSGDDILATCGISRKQTDDGRNTYFFESKARYDNARKIFTDKYSLTILRRFEFLEDKFFLNDLALSENFSKGFFDLAILNTQNDSRRYTTDVCLKIVDRLTEREEANELSRTLFDRLRYFIRSWSVNAERSSVIKDFYHQMLQTRERRGILGALLTYECKPLQSHSLSYLKALLDATGDDEDFVNLSVPRMVANNFRERLGDLFIAVEGWTDRADCNVPRSYSFAKISLSLLFYESRFSFKEAGRLEKAMVESLGVTQEILPGHSLIHFVFSNKTRLAFLKVYGKLIRAQAHTNHAPSIERMEERNLFSFYGFILIRWYYLLTTSASEKAALSTPEGTIKEALRVIHSVSGEKGLKMLRLALTGIMKRYNVLILQAREKTAEENKKGVYKTRRDIARQLKEMSEQIVIQNNEDHE